MTTLVTPEILIAAAGACGWPRRSFGLLDLADERVWRYSIMRATPPERARLLALLADDLLAAAPGGRLRLAARVADIVGEADPEPYLVGDVEALPVIRRALETVPPVVRAAIVAEVAFLATGRSSRAWTVAAAFRDATGRPKDRVVNLGPAAELFTVLHELAHVWRAGPPRPESCAVSVQGEEGLAAHAVDAGWSDRLAAWEREEETQADALALAWLHSRTPWVS